MVRSVWKGPFLNLDLVIKALNIREGKSSQKVIKTACRSATIIKEFVGITILVHNGKRNVPVVINELMIGHKLGEFAPTRLFRGHKKDKDSK